MFALRNARLLFLVMTPLVLSSGCGHKRSLSAKELHSRSVAQIAAGSVIDTAAVGLTVGAVLTASTPVFWILWPIGMTAAIIGDTLLYFGRKNHKKAKKSIKDLQLQVDKMQQDAAVAHSPIGC